MIDPLGPDPTDPNQSSKRVTEVVVRIRDTRIAVATPS